MHFQYDATFHRLDLEEVKQVVVYIGMPRTMVRTVQGFSEHGTYRVKDSMADCVRVEECIEAKWSE